jgi:uncharacterized RDD family membrane protein YckC
MQWYYAQNGQRLGPYGDADFAQLVNGGQVAGNTLVWHEGMANWQAYSQVLAAADLAQSIAGSSSSATAAASGQGETRQLAFCTQCGRYGNTSDMIAYEGAWVCPDCKETFFQRVREGLVATPRPGTLRYAGFWIRFAAHIIDGLVIGAANFIVVAIIVAASLGAMSSGHGRHPDAAMLVIQLIGNLVSVVLAMTYETWMVGAYGATLGKMACGLRVIRPSGQKVTYGRACARYWAKWLNLLTLLVGYIMAGFTNQKRALHDMICDTRVIWK